MATETATIRVARATRDRLAQQAQARGISLASLLTEVAAEREAELIWSAERAATRIDAENPGVAVEDSAWESTLIDGID